MIPVNKCVCNNGVSVFQQPKTYTAPLPPPPTADLFERLNTLSICETMTDSVAGADPVN